MLFRGEHGCPVSAPQCPMMDISQRPALLSRIAPRLESGRIVAQTEYKWTLVFDCQGAFRPLGHGVTYRLEVFEREVEFVAQDEQFVCRDVSTAFECDAQSLVLNPSSTRKFGNWDAPLLSPRADDFVDGHLFTPSRNLKYLGIGYIILKKPEQSSNNSRKIEKFSLHCNLSRIIGGGR